MSDRFRRAPQLSAVIIAAALGAACAAADTVEVTRSRPIAVTTEAPPATDATPPTSDEAPPPTDSRPGTTPPPTDPPVDELVADFEELMASGGATRPGGPAPRDPSLDDAAATHAATITADGDVTGANSESLYTALAEAGTFVDFLATSDLWADEAAGGGEPSVEEDDSSAILDGLDRSWAASPDLLAYGIGGDGTTAVLVARFAPLSDATAPAATVHFADWVAGLAATGVLPPVVHDPSLDAVVAHYYDDPWDPTLADTLGGTVAVSNEFFTVWPPADVAPPPAAAFMGEQHLASFNALRHPNAQRYGLRWVVTGPQEWHLHLLVVGSAPSIEQAAMLQESARAGALGDVNARRLEAGLPEIGWDPAAQAEAERIAAILAQRETIEETVRTDLEAWFFEDLLLPAGPYVAGDDVLDAVGGLETAPTLGFAMAQGANGLYYYVIVG